ncbi:MAG: phage antirepressor [Saccharofermentanales bacterium]|jgi:anti-repressor protein
MSELRVFENAEFGSVRSMVLDGSPWFVGKDVAEILGYSNSRKALLDHVDDEDKRDGVTIRDAIGREQTPVLINEAGLYSLILRSQLPNARKFKRWVTSEVLPAIRKHGIYATDYLIANPDLAIAAFTALKEEREENKKLNEALAIKQQQIAEMAPKATYYDIVLRCKDAVNISVIAKDYGMSAIRMNELLHELGVQFKQNDIWLLYQKHAPNGYTRTNTHIYEGRSGEKRTKVHTKWTQKGRLFIYDLLKAHGIVPQIEQEN